MSDGGSGDELTRLLTFLTGGNENPSSTQPGPTSRAEQAAMPFSPNGSPAVTNLLLTDPDADVSINAEPFSPSSNGSGGVMAIGFDGGGSKPRTGITNLLSTDPDASVSVDASPFNPETDDDIGVVAISAMSPQMSGGGSIVKSPPAPGSGPLGGFGQALSDLANGIGTFMIGVGDGVSGGLTNDIRNACGTNDVVDKDSLAYGGGVVTGFGMAVVIGGYGGAATGACRAAQVARGFNTAMGAAAAGKAGFKLATGQGDVGDVVTLALPLASRGLGKLAGKFSSALRNMGCFAAGTPILTPDGSKPIEDIRPGDWVMAAPDDDPEASAEPRLVEAAFENYLPTLDIIVNGRTIRTTAEHPFWVRARGWVVAQQIEAGHQLRTVDGRWLEVKRVEGPKPPAPVYNISVQEYHTYFVGHQIWGFSIWSHNGKSCTSGENAFASIGRRAHTNYNPGPAYKKGVVLDNGLKPDAVDLTNKIVRELKPDNPRAITKGAAQLGKYLKQLHKQYGGDWVGYIDTY